VIYNQLENGLTKPPRSCGTSSKIFEYDKIKLNKKSKASLKAQVKSQFKGSS